MCACVADCGSSGDGCCLTAAVFLTGAGAPVVAAASLAAIGAVAPALGRMGRAAAGACPVCMSAWAGVAPAAATTGAAAGGVFAPTEEPVIARLEVCRPAECIHTYVLLSFKAQWGRIGLSGMPLLHNRHP